MGKQRFAVITGGSSGIGAAVAAEMVARGDQVLVADLAEPQNELPFVQTDVRDPASVQAAFDAAEAQFGRVDFALLSAGLAVTMGYTPETVPWELYDKQWQVNVQGVVAGVRSAIPALRRAGGGNIVAMSSLAGLTPAPGDPLYSLTKFAVAGLVRAAAPMLAADAISINALCPGFVDTPMVDELREAFSANNFPLIPVQTLVEQVLRAGSAGGGTGQCYLVQPGVEPGPYRFRGVPGARTAEGDVAGVPSSLHTGEAVGRSGD